MQRHLLIANIVLGYLIVAEACGPGRGAIRRARMRKYTPLVQRQYIPNVSENTLGASGRPEGAIRRDDCRFNELVMNTNPDIEFRDDEGTGADRMMSQRLKEKLSALAISVMNQWPNVKLRVIEGWDEDYRHSPNSLHYEGRAVDITTSDKDRSKYGMLARLAVEAGFDWVHYESRSHVHCSVKSERADIIRNNGCFDANSRVQTPEGEVEMSRLQTNDLVLTMNPRSGQLQFSPVIMWLDRDEAGQELFVELKTKSFRVIRLTSSHLVYVADEPFDLTSNGEAVSKLTPFTGNSDNNRNDKRHYETTIQHEAQQQPFPHVPNTNSNSSQLPSTTSLSSLPMPKFSGANLDDLAFTTYARNVVVGQFLLVHSAESTPDASSEGINRIQTKSQQPSNNPPQTFYDISNDDDDDKKPYAGRLTFKDKPIVSGGDVQADSNVPEERIKIELDQIVSINYVTRKGIYAPLTPEGNIVVNSVVASCYAVINDHDLAHMSFAPVRWFHYVREWLFGLEAHSPLSQRVIQINDITGNQSTEKQGAADRNSLAALESFESKHAPEREIHWYPMMLYRIAKFILPTRYLY